MEHSHWSRVSRYCVLIGGELDYADAKVYAITTHLKAQNAKMPMPMGVFRPKAPSRGMVLYSIRELHEFSTLSDMTGWGGCKIQEQILQMCYHFLLQFLVLRKVINIRSNQR